MSENHFATDACARRIVPVRLVQTDPNAARSGLPPGITRWRLAAALRVAAPALGLTSAMLRLLEHYIDLTYDADWLAGSEPVVFRPMIEIAEHFGRSERQIRNIERALAERGLLTWKDSGNRHRRGTRDRSTGRILYAYGPSLAPLALCCSEILALAERTRAEAREKRALRFAISAAKRRLRAILEWADSCGAQAPDHEALLSLATARQKSGASINALRSELSRLETAAESTGRAVASNLTHWTGKREEPRQTERTPADAGHGETRIKAGQPEIFSRPSTETRPETTPPTDDAALVTALLTEAGERIDTPCSLDWRDIQRRATTEAVMLGLGQNAWRRGTAALGPDTAALCLFLTKTALSRSRRADGIQPQRVEAYFNALIARGLEGTLNLRRSLQWLHLRQRHKAPSPEHNHRTVHQTMESTP